jgi:hypothetical protein
MPVPCDCGSEDRSECGCPQDCYNCGYTVTLSGGLEWPTEGVIRCWDCQQKLIEFLLSQFQMHSPDMGGQHSYRFRNDGWPMTHLRGPDIDEALSEAMSEVERSRSVVERTNDE